jgi:hypothetical protein
MFSLGTRLFVGLLAVVLLAGACGRRTALLAPPPPSTLFADAEAALRFGDYARADDLYREMSEGPGGAREIALARRALIYALPGTDVHDRVRSRAFLDQLVSEFPATMLATEVEAVLGILPGIDDLRVTGEQRLVEIEALEAVVEDARRERERLSLFLDHAFPLDPEFDPERARADYREFLAAAPDSQSRRVMERILFLLAQWERLSAIGADHEARLTALGTEVRALRGELDRLKEIDLGRRLPD